MLRMRRNAALWLASLAMVAAVGGCKDESVIGSYTATTFTYTPTGGAPINVLTAGGSIALTINNDMSTGGSMVLPPSVTGGSTSSVSLLGNAAKSGDQVQLNLIADTFLRDIVYTFDGSSLSGSGTFSGTTVVVTLSK